MFGTGERGGRGDDHEAGRPAMVAGLRRRLRAMGGGSAGWPAGGGSGGFELPVPADDGVLAAPGFTDDGVLAAPAPLAEVLPSGGVPRGSVVSLAGPDGGGGMSLLLSMLAAPPDVWVAVVGMADIGMLAAAEMGIDLSRVGWIPGPGDDVAQVISVLADGVDVIAVAPAPTVTPARRRVLSGRLRQNGAVLMVAGHWPGADLSLSVREVRWSGVGEGYGRLKDRELDVQVGGRRAGAGMGMTVTVRLGAVSLDRVVLDTGRRGRPGADRALPDAVSAAPPAVQRADVG